jgi:archaeosine-15-forming tRNA-guanine transglycosylase
MNQVQKLRIRGIFSASRRVLVFRNMDRGVKMLQTKGASLEEKVIYSTQIRAVFFRS